MNRGSRSTKPFRSFGRGGRSSYRASGLSRGRGGFYGKRDSEVSSDRGRGRGRGDTSYRGRRYEGDRFKEAPSVYSARDYDRPPRRALTPPPPVDRSYGNAERDSYRFDRSGGGASKYRAPMHDSVPLREYRSARDFDDRYDFLGQRPGPYMDMPDYPMVRDYGRPVSRDYTPPAPGRRYSPDMRDVLGGRDVRDVTPPRRDYDTWLRSRDFGGSRVTAAAGSSRRDEVFARRAPSALEGSRSTEFRARRASPQRFNRDDMPPVKRSRDGPSRGGRPMSRGPRRRGGFVPRGSQPRRF